jgi:hypothetical protein
MIDMQTLARNVCAPHAYAPEHEIAAALRAAGVPLYADRYSDPTSAAEDQLGGRTHYADPATRRYFRSRILSAYPVMNGLFFRIVESLSADHNHTRRVFRVCLFDVWGTTVYRPDLDDSFPNRAAAERAFKNWEGINPAEYYAVRLEEKASRCEREADRLRDAIKQFAG